MPKPEKQVIEIGGRSFYASASRSIANDFWIMSEAKRLGLANPHMEPGESPLQFAQRLMHQAIDGGGVFTLLGGLLFPVDMKPEEWTEKTAEETGAFLRSAISDKDKETIRAAVGGMLARFFASGLSSATTSATSSGALGDLVGGVSPELKEMLAQHGRNAAASN